jgi:hypothetical protein
MQAVGEKVSSGAGQEDSKASLQGSLADSLTLNRHPDAMSTFHREASHRGIRAS